MLCSNKPGFSSHRRYTYIQIRSGVPRSKLDTAKMVTCSREPNTDMVNEVPTSRFQQQNGPECSSVYVSPDSLPRGHLVARPCSQFVQDPSKGVRVFPFCRQDLSKSVLVHKEVHPVLRLGDEAFQYH
ncbi:unnamed protein product [Urochloa humidicola]